MFLYKTAFFDVMCCHYLPFNVGPIVIHHQLRTSIYIYIGYCFYLHGFHMREQHEVLTNKDIFEKFSHLPFSYHNIIQKKTEAL